MTRTRALAIAFATCAILGSCRGKSDEARVVFGDVERRPEDANISTVLEVTAVAEDAGRIYEKSLESATAAAEAKGELARRPLRERLRAADAIVRQRRAAFDAAIPDRGLWLPEYTATGLSIEDWEDKQPGVPELRSALKIAEANRDAILESLRKIRTGAPQAVPWPHPFASARTTTGAFKFELPDTCRQFLLLAKDMNQPSMSWCVWVAPQGRSTLVTLSKTHLNATVVSADPSPESKAPMGPLLPMGGLVLLVIALVVYFIPTLIAARRAHHNTTAIFALNFLLGWTVLGWIGAFVWSLTSQPRTVTR